PDGGDLRAGEVEDEAPLVLVVADGPAPAQVGGPGADEADVARAHEPARAGAAGEDDEEIADEAREAAAEGEELGLLDGEVDGERAQAREVEERPRRVRGGIGRGAQPEGGEGAQRAGLG